MRYGIVSGDTLRKLHTTNVTPAWQLPNYDRRPADVDTKRAMLRHEWLEYVERDQGKRAE
jgi:hypothetical protein